MECWVVLIYWDETARTPYAWHGSIHLAKICQTEEEAKAFADSEDCKRMVNEINEIESACSITYNGGECSLLIEKFKNDGSSSYQLFGECFDW